MAQPDFATNDDNVLELAAYAGPSQQQARTPVGDWIRTGTSNVHSLPDSADLQKASRPPATAREDIVVDGVSKDELAAHLRAVSAETDTKIARMEGKMDLVLSKIEGLNTRISDVSNEISDSRRATRANAMAVGLGLAGLMLALAALVPTFYDLGGKQRDVIKEEVKTQMGSQKPPLASKP